MQKKRLQNKVKTLRQDLNVKQTSQERQDANLPLRKENGFGTIIEELRQGIIAVAGKLSRYPKIIDQYQKNRLFEKIS